MGVDLRVVQEMLGHSSIVLTADTYTSVLPAVAHTAAEMVATLIIRAGCLVPGTRLDEWAKDVAPSTELRAWYHHDPAKFSEFRQRYTAELEQPGPREALSRLRDLAAGKPVTLLTATKDLDLSQAAVLAGLLRDAT